MTPSSAVLDIGCGIGRLAVPMSSFLSPEGRYDGFDIVKKGILWCQRHITPKYPHFHFTHVDLKNDLYNLGTCEEAKNFVFPYESNSFDVATLFSVFTHMMPDDVDNYLSEIARVLKSGGACIATFFMIDEAAEKQIKAGLTGEFKFQHRYEGYALFDKKVKEANIAFEKNNLQQLIERHGLSIAATELGTWSDHTRQTTQFQDLIVLKKLKN